MDLARLRGVLTPRFVEEVVWIIVLYRRILVLNWLERDNICRIDIVENSNETINT
jgi:hypothetical protein